MMKKMTIGEVKSSFSFFVPIQVRYSDIDGYLHVNNGIYFNYFEHARAAYLYKVCDWDIMTLGTVVANVNIDYFTPIHAHDSPVVYIKCTHVGNSSFVLEQVVLGQTHDGEEKIFAKASTTMVCIDMKTMKPVPVPKEYASKMKNSSSVAG
ncbi:acyl-CoA thioesterase [Belliella marina]|uniref:Acyl-CoA thioesterase n=1 Tax=Belliella marina TaxID=1644146 RepID=A0ABW4VJ06_9BACT